MGVIRANGAKMERYVYTPHLTATTALIAFGQFYFNQRNHLLDDSLLSAVDNGRRKSIGEGSEPYGDNVEIRLKNTNTQEELIYADRKKNYVWVEGLEPDTAYSYEVFVDGSLWINAPLAEYSGNNRRTETGKRYKNIFKTFPSVDVASDCTFAVIGDFGTGDEKQYGIARELEKAIDKHDVRFLLTVGDNIYKDSVDPNFSAIWFKD